MIAFSVSPGAIKTQMTVNEPEELRNKLPHKPDIAGDIIAWLAGGSVGGMSAVLGIWRN